MATAASEKNKIKDEGGFYWLDYCNANDSNDNEVKIKPKLKEKRKSKKLTVEEIQEKLETANKRREVSRKEFGFLKTHCPCLPYSYHQPGSETQSPFIKNKYCTAKVISKYKIERYLKLSTC